MSLISRGQDFLNRTLGGAAGVLVTYTQVQTGRTAILTAWIGRTVFAQLPSGQTAAAVVYGDLDFLIPASALILEGVPCAPRRGDQVTWNGLVYEVVAPGGEPPWRFSDQTRTVYRIHTKRVT